MKLVHSIDVPEYFQEERFLKSLELRISTLRGESYHQALKELVAFLKKHPVHVRAHVMFEKYAPPEMVERFLKEGIYAISS